MAQMHSNTGFSVCAVVKVSVNTQKGCFYICTNCPKHPNLQVLSDFSSGYIETLGQGVSVRLYTSSFLTDYFIGHVNPAVFGKQQR